MFLRFFWTTQRKGTLKQSTLSAKQGARFLPADLPSQGPGGEREESPGVPGAWPYGFNKSSGRPHATEFTPNGGFSVGPTILFQVGENFS